MSIKIISEVFLSPLNPFRLDAREMNVNRNNK
jgi:hypothetical protein